MSRIEEDYTDKMVSLDQTLKALVDCVCGGDNQLLNLTAAKKLADGSPVAFKQSAAGVDLTLAVPGATRFSRCWS